MSRVRHKLNLQMAEVLLCDSEESWMQIVRAETDTGWRIYRRIGGMMGLNLSKFRMFVCFRGKLGSIGTRG